MAFRFYQHPAGVDAPSVTSLLGGVGEERLYNWRLRNALRFMYENDIQLSGRKDIDMVFEEVRDLSVIEADQGKWIHLLAEFHFAGKPIAGLYEREMLNQLIPDLEHDILSKIDTLKILESNFYKFVGAIGKYKVIASEQVTHGVLYGPQEQSGYYSGCIDNIIEQGRNVPLMDFKSGRDVYDNHIAQVAAYGFSYNEEQKFSDNPLKVNSLWVVKLGRTEGSNPYEIIKPKKDEIRMGMNLFHTALNLWYIRSGIWGNILPDREDEDFG